MKRGRGEPTVVRERLDCARTTRAYNPVRGSETNRRFAGLGTSAKMKSKKFLILSFNDIVESTIADRDLHCWKKNLELCCRCELIQAQIENQ
jgi:hypothetical protein